MDCLPSAEGHKVPGLISREIIAADDQMVTIREIWDPRVEGCPMVVFDRTVWPWVKRTDVASVTHTFKCPHYGDKPALHAET